MIMLQHSPISAISIHALLAESDVLKCTMCDNFFISIHALLAESDSTYAKLPRELIISIHALLAESDQPDPQPRLPPDISIHALLAESDYRCSVPCHIITSFLSTLSLRRATFPASSPRREVLFLSTLSLRRATKQSTVTGN